MKRKICFFMTLFISTNAIASGVCGPTVADMDYSYVNKNTGTSVVGYWAIGVGCNNNFDADTLDAACAQTIVVGNARCQNGGNISVTDTLDGGTCFCTRLKTLQGETLTDDVGQFVNVRGVASTKTDCIANCAQTCAEEVALNTLGFRNPIMLLPAL